MLQEASQDLPWILCDQMQIHGIEQTLIQEKCDRIDEQRPSIRNLGTKKLKLLIESIFQTISTNTSKDVTTARAFHLSKASYSRFAGSHWQPPCTPDLWKNLAGIIARHPAYTELAQTQGVWKTIQTITHHEPSLTSP